MAAAANSTKTPRRQHQESTINVAHPIVHQDSKAEPKLKKFCCYKQH
jgi:hypothetical protein